MCFSQTASFVAGGGLLGAGAVTMWLCQERRALPLAAMPALFGVQQITEGLVWREFGSQHHLTGDTPAAVWVYLLIQYVMWPSFFPTAVLAVEDGVHRRKLIRGAQLLGFLTAGYFLAGVAMHETRPVVSDHHINYIFEISYETAAVVCYVIAVLLAAFSSSHRWVRVLGAFIALGAPLAMWVSWNAGESIWCFFAAIASLILIVHFAVQRSRIAQ